jgi:2-oxoglutarate ferredoxin oxidoreductase subunit beta
VEILRRAHEHHGAAFIEIYQNCNVFNDKAFAELTGRTQRMRNRINLEHGKPIVFGDSCESGVVIDNGIARVVKTSEVGVEAIHVHDEHAARPDAAFALSRLSHGPYGPTPIGVFRDVERPTFGDVLEERVRSARETQGPGDLDELLRQTGTWTIE